MSTARRRAVEQDWHEKLGIGAGELARRIADVLYSGETGINTAETLLVESDIDITDLSKVVWAFATRAHPEHGELRIPGLPSDQLAIYLDEEEAHTFRAGQVIHNCLLAGRFPAGQRPVKGSLESGWPDDIRQECSPTGTPTGFPREQELSDEDPHHRCGSHQRRTGQATGGRQAQFGESPLPSGARPRRRSTLPGCRAPSMPSRSTR